MMNHFVKNCACAFLVSLLAYAGQAQTNDPFQQARSKLKDRKFTDARQDFERAKPKLLKVLAMPSGTSARQIHDATLRLRLRKMMPVKEKYITVLFIGSSMTLRWNMPLVVEKVAASAPAGRPRIISGQFTRGGTGIEVFWEDGDTHEMARGRIAAEPWDVVVLETSILRAAASNLKYGKLSVTLPKARTSSR